MYLLKVLPEDNADDLPQLVDFLPDQIPPYAILSHRWISPSSEEISFTDLHQPNAYLLKTLREKGGFRKMQQSCAQARKHGLEYLWIDTCCIDKTSSAELSEAINTMFVWYRNAQICFAFLADVPSTVDITSHDSELTKTEWATRGWTLQELLAPSEVIFYSNDWHEIGTKKSLSSILSVTTGIDQEYLIKENAKSLWSASIAKRMSWAAGRQTSRPEDIAYCLMGLFQVNMPMLYGEGGKAFIRLQEEIMKHSDDHSLFAWTKEGGDKATVHGLLAEHPKYFKSSGSIEPYVDRESRAPFSMTNRGLCIELHLTKLGVESLYAAALDCPVPPKYEDSSFLAIYLKKLPFSHGQYARVNIGSFGEARERGRLETIYVRQSIVIPDIGGIFPTHVFQLRKFNTRGAAYRVVQTMLRDPPRSSADVTEPIKTTQSTKGWVPADNAGTCKITGRGDVRSLFGVQILFEEMESIVVLLGTASLEVGFSVVETNSLDLSTLEQRKVFQRKFIPRQFSSSEVIGYHRVTVSAEPLVQNDAKYYMIDITVDALERPRDLVEEVLDSFEHFIIPETNRPVKNKRTVIQRLGRSFGGRKIN